MGWFLARDAWWLDAAIALGVCGVASLARQAGRSWLASSIAALLFALASTRGCAVSTLHAFAVAGVPFALIGVRWIASGRGLGMLVAGGTLSAMLALSERSSFACAFSIVALYGLMHSMQQPAAVGWRRAGQFLLALGSPLLLAFVPGLPFSIGETASPSVDSIPEPRETAPMTVVAALVLVFDLYVAHALLRIARDHPDKLRELHPSLSSKRWMRHADWLMAALSGLFLAWYASSALDSGAINLFRFVASESGFGMHGEEVSGLDSPTGPWRAAYLGPSLLLLGINAPALVPAHQRKSHFRFLLGAWMLCVLLAMQAPPFAQVWRLFLLWNRQAQLCCLGLAALLVSSVAAYSVDGLFTREQIRQRGVHQTMLAFIVAIACAMLVRPASGAALSTGDVLHLAAAALVFAGALRAQSQRMRVLFILPAVLALVELAVRT